MSLGGAADPMVGREFAGYRVERLLGRGGMGVVYLAEGLALGRKVALKLLSVDLAGDDRYRSRFLHESRLAASLDHPNVVPIYDTGEVDGRLFIAMRYVEGTDLRALLSKGPLAPADVIEINAGVAAALDVAHHHGLVHRDVKPANILLTNPPRHTYLADFGLSKFASAGPSVATIGEVVGTPDYVAPEQIRGEAIDGRTDVYSLGCVLYECLVGEPPFRGTGDLAALWAHLQREPVAPSKRRPSLPAALDPVLARALAKDPADRYPTCGELVDASAVALGIEGIHVARQATASSPARRSGWLGRPAAIAIAGALAVAIVAGSFQILARGQSGAGPTPGSSLGAGEPTSVASPAPSAGAFAAIQPGSVAFIDAGTGNLVDTLSLPGESTDESYYADGSFWLRGTAPDVLYRIDPNTRRLARTFTWGFESPNWSTVADGSIWVSDWGAPRAIQIDVSTGAKVREFAIPSDDEHPIEGAGGVAVGAGSLWVSGFAGADSVVARFDAATGKLQKVIPVPFADALRFGDASLWVTGQQQLRRIDPATNEIVSDAEVGPDSIYVAFGNGYAWTADPKSGQVWKVDPSGRIDGTYETGDGALPVAYADPSVWVANSRAGSLAGIDTSTGRIRILDVGHYPVSVAAGEGTLMVAIQESAADKFDRLPGTVLRVSTDYDTGLLFDAAVNWEFTFRAITLATCARLLNYRDASIPDGWTLDPEVAAAMPTVSADGRTYTFTIRPGFAFSPPSNAPITAEVFRYSLERALAPALSGQSRAIYYLGDVVGAGAFNEGREEHVEGIVVTGDGRLRITLEAPAADFLHRLAAHGLCPVPLNTPTVEGGVEPIAMSGPYYVSQHDRKSAVLTKNLNYPGGPRSAAFDAIAIELSAHTGSAIARVDAGELDVVMIPPHGLFSDLERLWGPDSPAGLAGDQRWHGVPATSTLFLTLNRTKGAFADPSIRKAFQLAIDRPAGAAAWREIALGRLVPPGVPGSGSDVVPVDDSGLAAARDLMGGRKATVSYAYNDYCGPGCPAFVKAIAPRLAEIGITLEATAVAANTCYSVFCDPAVASTYDIVDGVTQARYPDPYSTLRVLADFSVPPTWLTQADLDAIDRVGSLSGDERLAAAADVARRFVLDDAFIVPVSYSNGSAYFGPAVACRVMQPTISAVDLANLCPSEGTGQPPSPSP